MVASQRWSEKEEKWDIVWSWEGPQRVRTFLWLTQHENLLANQQRVTRHLSDSMACTLCRDLVEFTIHVLRDYSLAHALWDGTLILGLTGILGLTW